MSVALGSGQFRFEVVEDWAQLPAGWSFLEVAAVAVDRDDRVFVFSRGAHPVMVFAPDGTFLSSWGEGAFTGPHGATFGPDGALYLIDEGDHTVRRYSADGREELRIGVSGQPAAAYSGAPFNRPTDLAVHPDTGDLFISDGYGNSRIHCYAPDGEWRYSWGETGTDPGQFHLPHNLVIDRNGLIYVADRENHRVQIFDARGRQQGQWTNMHRACALWIERDGADERIYVSELGPTYPFSKAAPNLGPRISVYALDGTLLARLGDRAAGEEPGQFITPHGLAMDSRGDLYVGECSWSTTGRYLDPPRELRSLQKLVRRSRP